MLGGRRGCNYTNQEPLISVGMVTMLMFFFPTGHGLESKPDAEVPEVGRPRNLRRVDRKPAPMGPILMFSWRGQEVVHQCNDK